MKNNSNKNDGEIKAYKKEKQIKNPYHFTDVLAWLPIYYYNL